MKVFTKKGGKEKPIVNHEWEENGKTMELIMREKLSCDCIEHRRESGVYMKKGKNCTMDHEKWQDRVQYHMFRNHAKAYTYLMEYFDELPEESRAELHKKLDKLGL